MKSPLMTMSKMYSLLAFDSDIPCLLPYFFSYVSPFNIMILPVFPLFILFTI